MNNNYQNSENHILVYLDSADFSNFSLGKHLDIYSHLKELKNSGLVKFAFSWAHVSEMATINNKYSTEALKRYEVMGELCGRNSMIFFHDIAKKEVDNFALAKDTSIQAYSNRGLWFPEDEFAGIPAEVLAGLKEAVTTFMSPAGQNRAQRRAHSKQFPNNKTGITSALDALSKERGHHSFMSMCRPHKNLGEQFCRDIISYCSGDLNDSEVAHWVEAIFTDISLFYQVVTEFGAAMELLSAWTREPSLKLASILNEEAEVMSNIYFNKKEGAEPPGIVVDDEFWDNKAKESLPRLLESLSANGGYDIPADEVMQALPGLSVSLTSAWRTLKQSFAAAYARKFRSNDARDALHAFYFPYVDVFRCDSKFPLAEDVVPQERRPAAVKKIEELPSAIDSALKRKGLTYFA